MSEIKTNKYEVVMVFSLADGEDKAKALVERFSKLIEDNGTIDEVEDWGKRRLAYPINDEFDAYYNLTKFSSNADFPKEFERVFRITDGGLRSMIVRLDG